MIGVRAGIVKPPSSKLSIGWRTNAGAGECSRSTSLMKADM